MDTAEKLAAELLAEIAEKCRDDPVLAVDSYPNVRLLAARLRPLLAGEPT